MPSNAESVLTLFHSPRTRSTGIRILLEELEAPHRLQPVDVAGGEQRQAGYLAINPMGKVPAVLHQGQLITEQAALCIFLADLFPAAGLAPAIDEPLRGPYLRWLVFYGSCFEPAVLDRALQRAPAPLSMCPYGDWETTMATLGEQLSLGPFLLGERFSAADVLWGIALRWVTEFGLVPSTPVIRAYVDRVVSRPAAQRVLGEEAALPVS
ncbi:glutathione S-transferase [Sphaerotilus hippei]|uniref:Glutathione S-transferase n=1 Tax=Sphaerotilus hippei TaxID=744406 RepID=A0A318H0F2_9BURK|nr:glutathione S-transferase family protein [Sphaerotilus hippei]PXW94702.1 glutathione S-transferase [Sphaerotilus hippei]